MESCSHSHPNPEPFQISETSETSDRISTPNFSCTKLRKLEEKRVMLESSNESPVYCKKTLKRWTEEEDSKLLSLFYKIGNDWAEIARNMKGRAKSAVKNRFYTLYNSKLSVQTMSKIKNTCLVKKMYKSPVNSSELFRKINNYLNEEVIFQSFLDVESPEPFSHLIHKLNITPETIETHTKMQKLIEQAQLLYKSCEKAKACLASWN